MFIFAEEGLHACTGVRVCICVSVVCVHLCVKPALFPIEKAVPCCLENPRSSSLVTCSVCERASVYECVCVSLSLAM